MAKPTLTIIAGCNGSGKSSFSNAFCSDSSAPFDYDKVYLKFYENLLDTDVRELMAHNKARQNLELAINNAIHNQLDFTYETNFNSTPLFWPEKFKKAGYNLRLVFFCLNSIEEAKRRVQIRVENGGHFVPENEIRERYELGYKHLNQHWKYFDDVILFDTSTYNEKPKYILSVYNGKIEMLNGFPEYLKSYIPDIK
jgi:predicted ABC-type ATPase